MASSAVDLARGLLAQTLTGDEVRMELSSQTGSLDGSDDLVHCLECYVADQDIRARDRDYARWQEAELRKLLPPSDAS